MDETTLGRLSDDYDDVCGRLGEKIRELLGALARIADATFPGRVAGASLRDGTARVDFVEGFVPAPGDGRLAAMSALTDDVDAMARLAARHGVERDMSVRLGEAGTAAAPPLH